MSEDEEELEKIRLMQERELILQQLQSMSDSEDDDVQEEGQKAQEAPKPEKSPVKEEIPDSKEPSTSSETPQKPENQEKPPEYPEKALRITVQKTMLDHPEYMKGFPLPEGWTTVAHESGMIVYLHKFTRVVSLSRPYTVDGPIREHPIPTYAIPCLHRQIMEEKEKQQQAEKLAEEQKNPQTPSETSETSEKPVEQKPQNPSETSEKPENPLEKKSPESTGKREKKTPEQCPIDYLNAKEYREYCSKRFRFKEMTVHRYADTKQKAEAHQARKTNAILKRIGFEMSYDEIKKDQDDIVLAAPSGAALIDLTPLESSKRNGPRKPYLLNPMGKTTVSVLNEFVQRLAKGTLVYLSEEGRTMTCPYKATAILSMRRSVLKEMSGHSREILTVLCEIARTSEEANNGDFSEEIIKFPIGKGLGANKRTARLLAARDALSKLVPRLRVSVDDNICQGLCDPGDDTDFEKKSRELFKQIPMESSNLVQLCTSAGITKPFQLLKNAVSRSMRWNGLTLSKSGGLVENGKSKVVLKLGEMEQEAQAIGQNQASHMAAQLLFKQMHPEFTNYGSFLQVYDRLEDKEMMENARKQHDEVVRLADTGNLLEPNHIVLGKLSEEMKKVTLIHPPRQFLFGAVNVATGFRRAHRGVQCRIFEDGAPQIAPGPTGIHPPHPLPPLPPHMSSIPPLMSPIPPQSYYPPGVQPLFPPPPSVFPPSIPPNVYQQHQYPPRLEDYGSPSKRARMDESAQRNYHHHHRRRDS